MPAAQSARARSYVYGLLATALRVPDEDLLVALCQTPDEWIEPLPPAVRDRVDALRQAADSADVDELNASHVACFGHAVRGACPPYELEYGGSEIIQQASELADVAGFYEAFGLTFDGPEHDRPDHISAECEFMQVMTIKEALALEADNVAQVDQCRTAQRAFLLAHWCAWVPAFAHRLIEADADGFHGRVGRCLEAFVTTESEAFDIETGPIHLELRPVDPKADTVISCGEGEGCPSADGDDTLVPLNPPFSAGENRK